MPPHQSPPLPRSLTLSQLQKSSTLPADEATMALTLVTTWIIRTGRSIPPVPVNELSAEEIEDFWADEQMLDKETSSPSHAQQLSAK